MVGDDSVVESGALYTNADLEGVRALVRYTGRNATLVEVGGVVRLGDWLLVRMS